MSELITEIGKTKIKFSPHPNGVRFETEDDNLLFPNMQAGDAVPILQSNFEIVYLHFKAIAKNNLEDEILQQACFKIVVFYFYMYALWRAYNENQKGRDLNFLDSDFNHPYTFDKVREFFLRHHHATYAEKSAAMLGMQINAFKEYEQQRQDFYDMW